MALLQPTCRRLATLRLIHIACRISLCRYTKRIQIHDEKRNLLRSVRKHDIRPHGRRRAVCSAGSNRGVLTITRACLNRLTRKDSESGVELGGEHAQGCWTSNQGSRPKMQKCGDLARRTRSASILLPRYGKLALEALGSIMRVSAS